MIDKKKIYRRLIILCWVVLVFYLLMKLLFGYTLEIVCNNARILAICNFVDNNIIANYIVSSIFCFVMLYFYYGAIVKKVKLGKKELIILISTTLIANLIYHIPYIGNILSDITKFYIAPMIMLGKFKWKNLLICFIAYLLNFVFQIISLITSGTKIGSIQNSMLINMVFSIDVIIMLIITCLFRKEK